jgi:hypothetical protein
MNFASAELGALELSINHAHLLWVFPIFITIASFFLYHLMGSACFVGLAAYFFFLLLQIIVSQFLVGIRSNALQNASKRIQMSQETMSGMSVIKYHDW